MTKKVDPAAVRDAVVELADWLRDEDSVAAPTRQQLALAVRGTARLLAADAPGHSVEVRVPPFVAVQCIDGPRHTRGTPPNVIECSPRTWLLLATGLLPYEAAVGKAAVGEGAVEASGTRAGEIARWLPVVTLPGRG